MFEFSGGRKPESICYVTHGTLGHLDPQQPPVRRKPYSNILDIPFVHKVELVLPKELYEILKDHMPAKFPEPAYSRVIMPLLALVQGDFFTEYIKKGDILMLSEGRNGLDNVYSLKNGILTLSLEKESYERAGLVGKPEGVKGKRGTRQRWIVEINLRLPSMLHGKKGFDRIIYAFKNALTTPITWLFTDLTTNASAMNPIDQYFPTEFKCSCDTTENLMIQMRNLVPPSGTRTEFEDGFRDYACETYEWLSLIGLDSPRVEYNDSIDPFLARYTSQLGQRPGNVDLVKIAWKGFMSANWAHKAFAQAVLAASPHMWFSFFVSGFNDSLSTGSRDCTILTLPGSLSEYVLWEVGRS